MEGRADQETTENNDDGRADDAVIKQNIETIKNMKFKESGFLFEKKTGQFDTDWTPCRTKEEQNAYIDKLYRDAEKSGDYKLIKEVLTHNLSQLVYSIAGKLNINNSDLEDIYMYGLTGILEKAESYLPERGAPSNYFYNHIKHAIIVGLSHMLGSTQHHMENMKKIRRAINELLLIGESVTDEAIAEITGMTVDTIQKENIRHGVILFEPIRDDSGEDSGLHEIDRLEATAYLPEDVIERHFAKQVTRDVFAMLNDEERLFTSIYFGFVDTWGLTNLKNGKMTDAIENLANTCRYMNINITKGRKLLRNIYAVFERYRRLTGEEKRDLKKKMTKKHRKFTNSMPSRKHAHSILSSIDVTFDGGRSGEEAEAESREE